ncbi:MAG: MFS transporter, partial [Acidimicrobiaceae bacterium]|nr:MFS transporter [Acidimicrobiaceae bacterium]
MAWPLRLGGPPGGGPAPATPFRRLAVVHLLSTAGDAITAVALAGSVFVSVSLTAARSRTAIGLVCTLLPFLVVGPFLGRVIDATPGGRKSMLSLASLGRAFGCILMAQWVHGLLFFPAAFITLVCSKAYLVSRAAIVPGMVERHEDLVPANAKLAVGSAGSSLLAGGLGAAIFRLTNTPSLLYLNAVLLVVCAVLATRLRPVRTGDIPSSPTPVGQTVRADRPRWRQVLAAVSGPASPASHLPPGGVAAVSLAMAGMRASAGLMTSLVVFGFRRDGAPLYWYGLVGVASVAGNLGGAVLAPIVREQAREERIVPGCALGIGVVALFVLQLPLLHRWPAALILAVSVTLLAAIAKLAFDALVQRDTSPERRGGAFARIETLFQFVWVVAALIPVGLVMPLEAGFAVVGALTLGGVAATWRGLYLARRDRLP